MVRAGFRMILESEPDIEVVGEAANGEQAVGGDPAPAARRRADGHPDARAATGCEATRRITADPELRSRVVILTTFERDEYVFEALQAGASGFLLKNAPPEELVDAVRVVAAGDALLAPSVTRRIIEQFARRPVEAGASRARLESLTQREREVLRAARPRQEQQRAGGRAVRHRGHDQDARLEPAGQARAARPRPGRRPGLRERAGHARAGRRASVVRQRRRRRRSALRRSSDASRGR